MHLRIAQAIITASSALLLAGCIHHEETVYRDAPRAKVDFENDRAARLFYETLNRGGGKNARAESKTEVDVPLVFHDKRRVVDGPNAAFNKAVEECDLNRDGKISEQEAQIFAESKQK